MAIDFPASPINGQTFAASNGITYVWASSPGIWTTASYTNVGWRLLTRTVITGSTAVVDFTNIASDINDIEVRFDAIPISNDDVLLIQIYDGSGTLQTTNYPWSNYGDYSSQVVNASPLPSSTSSSVAVTSAVAMTYYAASNAVMNSALGGLQGKASINNIRNTTRTKAIIYQVSYLTNAGSYEMSVNGAGKYNTVGAITGIRLFFIASNIAAGSFSLYGSP